MSKRVLKQHRERLTQKFVFVDYETVGYNQLTETIISLTPSQAGLGVYSDQLANFCDMYRFARIDVMSLEVACVNNEALQAGSANTAWPGWVVSFVPPGATPPTNLLGIETDHCVLGAGAAGATHSVVKLNMRTQDFAPLADAGPGPGWIPTQSDGPATSFGSIVLTSTTPVPGSATNDVEFSWRMALTMSFDQLVDPSTIAFRLKSRPERVPRSLKKEAPADDLAKSSKEDLTLSRLQEQVKRLTLRN